MAPASARPVVLAFDVSGTTVKAAALDDHDTVLADGLVTVCALLALGAVIVGGGLSQAGAALTDQVEALMRKRSVLTTVPPVLVTTLGSRAGLVGAAHLALDAVAELGS